MQAAALCKNPLPGTNCKRMAFPQMIDEVHTLIGAGAAEGAIDAANILKPALARGELQCIGATTLDEYRKHIEKDPALERRFQPVRPWPSSSLCCVYLRYITVPSPWLPLSPDLACFLLGARRLLIAS